MFPEFITFSYRVFGPVGVYTNTAKWKKLIRTVNSHSDVCISGSGSPTSMDLASSLVHESLTYMTKWLSCFAFFERFLSPAQHLHHR